MEITIRAEAEEIAALVLAVQGRQEVPTPTQNLVESIRGTLLEFAGKL